MSAVAVPLHPVRQCVWRPQSDLRAAAAEIRPSSIDLGVRRLRILREQFRFDSSLAGLQYPPCFTSCCIQAFASGCSAIRFAIPLCANVLALPGDGTAAARLSLRCTVHSALGYATS